MFLYSNGCKLDRVHGPFGVSAPEAHFYNGRRKMKLNRSSKKLLNVIISSEPTIQKKAYDYYEIGKKADLSENEYVENLKYLEKVGAIDFENGKIGCFRLTSLGRHYREFRWFDFREFFLKSILVPIFVSVLTTTAIHMLGSLL